MSNICKMFPRSTSCCGPWRKMCNHNQCTHTAWQNTKPTMYGDVRPGLRPGLRPSVRPSIRSPSVRSPSARFPHFSPTCLDILSWNFAHDFVLMYYRSSWSVITLRQFLKELCLFVNLEYRQYTVFRTFLLHTLHIELKFCAWLCFNVLQSKF